MKNFIQNPKQKVVITFDNNETLARIYEDNKVVAKGIAICSPEDEFDIKAGCDLALTRALEAMKPKETPKTQEWVVVNRKPRVGDYIRVIYKGNPFGDYGDILRVSSLDGDGYAEINIKNHPKCKKWIDEERNGHWFYQSWIYASHNYEVVEPAPKKPEFRKITRLPKKGDYARVIRSVYDFDKPDRYLEIDDVTSFFNILIGFNVATGKHPGAIEAGSDFDLGWHYSMLFNEAEFYEKV